MNALDQDPEGRAERLTPLVEQARRRWNVPAVAVAVLDGEEIVTIASGAARTAPTRPATTATVFEAASLGKPVLARVAMSLVDAGVLTLDAPLATYLPSRWVDDPRIEQVTTRHVLSHQSGLKRQSSPPGVSFRRDPAIEFEYSNEGYLYLQTALTHLTGLELDELASAHAFDPLGMKNSSYQWRPEYETTAAFPHDADGSQLGKWRPRDALAASSLHSTASDIAALLRDAATADRAPFANLVRPHITVREVWGGGPPDDGSAWSLGWGIQVDQNPSVWHWGWNDGFRSFAVAWPHDRNGIVCMTNGDNGLWVAKQLVTAFRGYEHPAFRWLEH